MSSASVRPEEPLAPSKKKLCQYSCPRSKQPTNVLPSLPNLQVPRPNLFVPPNHMAEYNSYTNSALPQPNSKMLSPYQILPPEIIVPASSALLYPNLAVPPPNFFFPPKSMDGLQSYPAILIPPNLSVPSPNSLISSKNASIHRFYPVISTSAVSKQTATVKTSTNSSTSFQVSRISPRMPISFQLPIEHFVQRESKYYNKYRRNFSKKNFTNLCKTAEQVSSKVLLLKLP